MKNMLIKQMAAVFAAVLLLLTASGCGRKAEQDDIVILFTNDVHCAVEEGIGYAGLVAYEKNWKAQTPHVVLVDCGDAVQGDAIGTATQGQYPIDIMNQAGYDFAVPGNHEFNYGIGRLSELLKQSQAQYLSCNIAYTGKGKNPLSAISPYEIVTYGSVKVAFVGISTPESIVKATPTYFMDETGAIVYDFFGESGEELYQKVQDTVDVCRQQGADYVIVLSHLGDDEDSAPFRSTDVIAATNGIDAVLDGHAHSVIPCDMVYNRDGKVVPLSSTGTAFASIGQLMISPNGSITVGLVSSYPERDQKMETYIQTIQSQYQADLNKVVAKSEVELTTGSPGGIRYIRNRETNLGDFCADAYRAVAGADIAMVNGGGIRADLPAGEITYRDIFDVHPYGNTLCLAEATGQEILDALEMASRSVLPKTDDGENAVGENGGFLQVSGLRYTVDTSVPSTVVLNEAGMYVSSGANRRVKNVEVLQPDGSYLAIEPDKTYTVASHNYLIKQGGDGLTMFMDNHLLIDEGMADYQVLITYITEYLDGTIGKVYETTGNRITIQ